MITEEYQRNCLPNRCICISIASPSTPFSWILSSLNYLVFALTAQKKSHLGGTFCAAHLIRPGLFRYFCFIRRCIIEIIVLNIQFKLRIYVSAGEAHVSPALKNSRQHSFCNLMPSHLGTVGGRRGWMINGKLNSDWCKIAVLMRKKMFCLPHSSGR